jgi:hypothetical protein
MISGRGRFLDGVTSPILHLCPRASPCRRGDQERRHRLYSVRPKRPGQARAFLFQKYGLLTGKVVRVSADATEQGNANANANGPSNGSGNNTAAQLATYKARIALEQQYLTSPQGAKLQAGAGMQVAVEIHQGRRTVLEYLLSPVAKAVQEAGREK